MNKFSERLRDLRNEKGISRAELADRLNVSVRLIAYWENGQRECGFDMLISLSEFFARARTICSVNPNIESGTKQVVPLFLCKNSKLQNHAHYRQGKQIDRKPLVICLLYDL